MSIYGDNCPLLLSPKQLRDIPSADVTILDASWHMPNSARHAKNEFLNKHIPGAQHLDLDEVASSHELGLKHMMPSGDVFAKACENFGIKPSSHVILYDVHGIFSAPRALFMFRAFGHNRSSVLDGGLPAWEAHGCPTESGEPLSATKSEYPTPKVDESVIRDYVRMVSNSSLDLTGDSVAELVVDARSNGRWLGSDPEPRPGLPSGHIPNSFSLPFQEFLENNTYTPPAASSPSTYSTYRSPEALHVSLQKALGPENAKAILEGKRGIVTSCGSGMTAGVLWLGLKLMGVERIGLYDESWTGYAMRKESPIDTGKQ